MRPAKASSGFFVGLTANYDLLYKSYRPCQHDLYNFSSDYKMAKKKKQWGGKRPGAGRPTSNTEGPTVLVAVTVPETLIDRLEGIAKASGWNKSEAVTQAIRAFIAMPRRG
jgi:hypothetical protein